jgi:hypothetical protein
VAKITIDFFCYERKFEHAENFKMKGDHKTTYRKHGTGKIHFTSIFQMKQIKPKLLEFRKIHLSTFGSVQFQKNGWKHYIVICQLFATILTAPRLN